MCVCVWKVSALLPLSPSLLSPLQASQQAQKDHTSLFQVLFFKGLAEEDERSVSRGVVYAIKPNGVMVHIPR